VRDSDRAAAIRSATVSTHAWTPAVGEASTSTVVDVVIRARRRRRVARLRPAARSRSPSARTRGTATFGGTEPVASICSRLYAHDRELWQQRLEPAIDGNDHQAGVDHAVVVATRLLSTVDHPGVLVRAARPRKTVSAIPSALRPGSRGIFGAGKGQSQLRRVCSTAMPCARKDRLVLCTIGQLGVSGSGQAT